MKARKTKTDTTPLKLPKKRYRVGQSLAAAGRKWWSLMAVCSKGCKPLPGHLSPANGCTGSRTMGGEMEMERIEAKGGPEVSVLIAPRWRSTIQSLIYAIKIHTTTAIAATLPPSVLPPLPSAHTHRHTQFPLIGWGLGAGKAFNCLWLSCFPFSCSLILFFFGPVRDERDTVVAWDTSGLKNGNKSIDSFGKEWTQQGRSHHTRRNEEN